MTRRDNANSYLKERYYDFTGLMGEIRHHYEGVSDREYSYDLFDALVDTLTQAEENDDVYLLGLIRRVLIDVGFYREMSQEEAARTECYRNGRPIKPYDFKFGGKMYVSDESFENWGKA